MRIYFGDCDLALREARREIEKNEATIGELIDALQAQSELVTRLVGGCNVLQDACETVSQSLFLAAPLALARGNAKEREVMAAASEEIDAALRRYEAIIVRSGAVR